MYSQGTITIAGLGSGSASEITLGALEVLKTSNRTFLRTGRHPVVEWLHREGITFSTFDHYYQEADGFQEVYRRIAETLLEEAGDGPVVYAVPGHPLVSEESVQLLLEKAGQAGIKVDILPAVSYLDSLFLALRIDPGKGLQVLDGLSLRKGLLNPEVALVVTQVYNRLTASDVKLRLLEKYPPEYPVTVVRGAGLTEGQRMLALPLFELDRLNWIDHLTTLYLPAAGSGSRDMGSGKWEVGSGELNESCGKEQEGIGIEPLISLSEQDGDEDGEVEVVQVFEADESPAADCAYPLDLLVTILARLRAKDGCPWDREQDHRTLRPYLLEEAYEVLEALNEEDMYKICEELGDLLLQIVFHAQIASENRCFDMNDVVAGISEKMIRRHPHVFGSVTAKDSGEVLRNWEKIKAEEKDGQPGTSFLGDVSLSQPALTRAFKLQEKAAKVGFDWPDYQGALEKTREELAELELVILSGNKVKIEEELGDLLFSAVNLARLLRIEPEVALAETCRKFIGRFEHIENMARLTGGRNPSDCSLAEMDQWWEEAKHLEKKEKI